MLNNIRAFLVKETDYEKKLKNINIFRIFSVSGGVSFWPAPYERLFSEALSSHTSTSREVLMMCYCGRWNLENFAAHMGQVKNWPLLDPEFIKASSSSLYVTKVEENHMNSEYDPEKSRSYGAGQKLTPPRSGIYQGLLPLFICNKSWRKLCYMRLHAATCSDKVAFKRAKIRQNAAECGKIWQNTAKCG